jgi:glutamate racemase
VLRHGSGELVELAERKLRGEPVAADAVGAALAGLFGQPGGDRMDTVVLACTHFPLLRAELAACAPRPLRWIDSGGAIARRDAPPTHRVLFTARSADIEKMRPALAQRGLDEVAFLDGL